MGYIYGVVFRTIQGLSVSPIEVVALTLSIRILIKALLHNIVSTCHRSLHVYLTDEDALTFVGKCAEYKTDDGIPESHVVGPPVVMVLLVSSVMIYYIIHMWQTTRRIMVVPIMLTLVGLHLQVWGYKVLWSHNFNAGSVILPMCAMVNATSYILALVVTIKYWEVDRLNVKTSRMLARIFPYIG